MQRCASISLRNVGIFCTTEKLSDLSITATWTSTSTCSEPMDQGLYHSRSRSSSLIGTESCNSCPRWCKAAARSLTASMWAMSGFFRIYIGSFSWVFCNLFTANTVDSSHVLTRGSHFLDLLGNWNFGYNFLVERLSSDQTQQSQDMVPACAKTISTTTWWHQYQHNVIIAVFVGMFIIRVVVVVVKPSSSSSSSS